MVRKYQGAALPKLAANAGPGPFAPAVRVGRVAAGEQRVKGLHQHVAACRDSAAGSVTQQVFHRMFAEQGEIAGHRIDAQRERTGRDRLVRHHAVSCALAGTASACAISAAPRPCRSPRCRGRPVRVPASLRRSRCRARGVARAPAGLDHGLVGHQPATGDLPFAHRARPRRRVVVPGGENLLVAERVHQAVIVDLNRVGENSKHASRRGVPEPVLRRAHDTKARQGPWRVALRQMSTRSHTLATRS